MLVTVRLFARLREIAGRSDVAVELAPGATARDAWHALASRHTEFGAYGNVISCAVNEEYARLTTELHDGDEVAFLPPVSGGGTGSDLVSCRRQEYGRAPARNKI